MREKDIRHLLFQLSIPTNRVTYAGSSKRTRWMNVSCPFAPFTHAKGTDRNPSFGITIVDDGRSSYKCLSCGTKGRLAGLPTKLAGYRKKNYSQLAHWANLVEIDAAINRPIVDWDEDEQQQDFANTEKRNVNRVYGAYPKLYSHPYLRQRGIYFPTPAKLGLEYDPFQRRILFPCFYADDTFGGYTGRSTISDDARSKDNPKVRDYYQLEKRKLLLGLPGEQTGKKIVVEGLIDYAACVQAGFRNTKCILGTALTPEKLDILIQDGDPVYFFMDNDIAGWQALFGILEDGERDTSNAWAYNLYTEVPVWIVPYPNNFGVGKRNDPGSLPSRMIRQCIDRAWLFMGKPPMDDMEIPNLLIPDTT